MTDFQWDEMQEVDGKVIMHSMRRSGEIETRALLEKVGLKIRR